MTSPLFRRERRRRGQSRTAVFERNILRLHSVTLGLLALFVMLPAFDGGHWHPAEFAVRVGTMIVYTVVIVDLLRNGERPRHLAILLLPLFAVWAMRAQDAPGDVSAGLVASAFTLSAARLLHRLWVMLTILVLGVFYLFGRLNAQVPMHRAIDDYLLAGAMAIAIIGFVDTIERAVARAEETDAALAGKREALSTQRARSRALDEVGRVLHDDVLAALLAFQQVDQDPDGVRAGCLTAAASVRQLALEFDTPGEEPVPVDGPDRQSRGTVIDQLLRVVLPASPIDVDVDMRGRPGLLPSADPDLAAILSRSVAEALRNVARHADVSSATIRINARSRLLSVEVVDHGTGTVSSIRPGYGTKHSILEPVEAIGGSATYLATPGGGLTLRIEIPMTRTSPLDDAYRLATRASNGKLPIIGISWLIGLVWIYLGVGHSFSWPVPSMSLALVALFLVLGVILVAHVESTGHTAPNARVLLVVNATLLAACIVGYWQIPAGGLLDYRSWFVGWAGIFLIPIVTLVPLTWGITIVAAHIGALVVAWILNPAMSDDAVPWGSLNALVLPSSIALIFGHLVRTLGADIEEEEAEMTAASIELATRQVARTISSVHLDYTRRVVVPWLREAARAERIEELAPQAALLAWEVRDDLYAPGVFDDDLRRAANQFRAQGGRLELRFNLVGAAPTTRLNTVITGLVEAVPPPSAITLKGAAAEGLRATILPPVPAPLGLPETTEDTDEYRTVVTIPAAHR